MHLNNWKMPLQDRGRREEQKWFGIMTGKTEECHAEFAFTFCCYWNKSERLELIYVVNKWRKETKRSKLTFLAYNSKRTSHFLLGLLVYSKFWPLSTKPVTSQNNTVEFHKKKGTSGLPRFLHHSLVVFLKSEDNKLS